MSPTVTVTPDFKAHYRTLAIEPDEYAYRNKLPFAEASAIKYITRHRLKGKREDLEKAIRVLQKLVEWEYPKAPDYLEGANLILPTDKAAGHNPDNLTNEQVGVAEGWRLLERGEVRDKEVHHGIECWIVGSNHWDKGRWFGSHSTHTYRTKQPPGYFLEH